MNRVARWRVWVANLILGLPRSRRYVFHASATGEAVRQPPIHRFMQSPDDEVGVAVPAQEVLTANDEAMVAVTGCVAFTTGFHLNVGIRRRNLPPPVAHPMLHGEFPERTLEVGVRFADGTATTSSIGSEALRVYLQANAGGADPPLPSGPMISHGSGGGGGRRWDWEFFVWPLPPNGPLTVTCRWPEGNVPDGKVDLDGTAIRRAGESSRRLWSG
jgi:hypothetical protein